MSPPARQVALGMLLRSIAVPARDVLITDLFLDSREVVPGGAFLACAGRSTHGLAHLPQALQGGAAVVLWEPADGCDAPQLPQAVVGVCVPRLGALASELAGRFFDHPSASLRVAGFTGTNGKTTSAYVLAQAAGHCGLPTRYLGTIGHGRPGQLRDANLTTPDAVTLQRRLAESREDGAAAMCVEVSSHALDQQRVAAVHFDTAVLTNLTRDHLDYHVTPAAYAAAKARLFAMPGLAHRVLNAADDFGRELAALPGGVPTTNYSARIDRPAPRSARWLQVLELRTGAQGLALRIDGHAGEGWLESRLIGAFNAENLLAALAVLLGWQLPLEQALAALARCEAPPGRMQSFGDGQGRLAIVDYAHTPDALAKALLAARAHTRGRLSCVFGCGGDRDPGKRPQMGAIAEQLADVVIVTDDNPRSEDAATIRAQIVAGLADPTGAREIADRAEAIATAIGAARDGDVVLVAGKGHEEYQIVGHEVRAFSDRAQVLAALALRP